MIEHFELSTVIFLRVIKIKDYFLINKYVINCALVWRKQVELFRFYKSLISFD